MSIETAESLIFSEDSRLQMYEPIYTYVLWQCMPQMFMCAATTHGTASLCVVPFIVKEVVNPQSFSP